jgi:hypothetical protein
MMQMVYQIYYKLYKNSVLCNVLYTKFQDRVKDSQRYQVIQSSTGVCQVQIPNTGIKYIVDLKERSCSYNNFFQYQGPCAHAIAACQYKAEDPFNHFDSTYKVRKFRRTHEVLITPISIENLDQDKHM